MVAQRAKARGLSEKDYMGGNLLGREVYASEVAEAFVYLAHAEKTTAAVITVDGGNIEASLRYTAKPLHSNWAGQVGDLFLERPRVLCFSGLSIQFADKLSARCGDRAASVHPY